MVTLYSKKHNSELNIIEIIAPFYLEILVIFFISINNSIIMFATAFKLHTLVQCHYVTLYIKFHNSELNINEINLISMSMKLLPLFYIEILVG